MNREMRRDALKRARKSARKMGAPDDMVWIQTVTCLDCGLQAMHVELSTEPDEAQGMPDSMRCVDCGGKLAAARRRLTA